MNIYVRILIIRLHFPRFSRSGTNDKICATIKLSAILQYYYHQPLNYSDNNIMMVKISRF